MHKKTMTDAAIEANRKNAQLSTGPQTEEGKQISSMNALKTGYNAKHFWKIRGKSVGELKICPNCGDEQIELCKSFPLEDRTCLLYDNLLLKYTKTHQTGETKYIEEINMAQLASMDLLFSQNLRYAQINMGEFNEYTDDDGNKIKKPKIGNDYIYMLITFMKALSKTLPDMQLTKQTQENIDAAWAELARAEIYPQKAAEHRNKIMNEMAAFRKAQATANAMEKKDEAITHFRKNEDLANEDIDNVNIGDAGDNPFEQNK